MKNQFFNTTFAKIITTWMYNFIDENPNEQYFVD